ncbi:uncharacterized protein LOC112680997 [Sipha flava]|uniref:Uncharacterized protein LOC112680997 n=1 Tax=Sipha flava TaxID=143950 RepID=A0A8B8F887_9HEMI|nr:uncharacterized protein LOC112680997 [Sipha flava]
MRNIQAIPREQQEDAMMRILQINLNCCKVAQQLMLQIATEKKADVLIICEQNATPPHWYADKDGKTAIAIHQGTALEETDDTDRGYVWVRIGGVRIYSCYILPNITINEYIEYLERLESSMRSGSREVILAGDFNAKNLEWGSITDQRGDELAALAASLNLIVCNIRRTPTFERASSHSILDLTFALPITARQMVDWSVLDEETRSDHKYLFYRIGSNPERHPDGPTGWCRKNVDQGKLKEYLDGKQLPRNAHDLMENIRGACDAVIPRINPTRGYHKPQYWWTNEISELRRASLTARRWYQKAAMKGLSEEEKQLFKTARKTL